MNKIITSEGRCRLKNRQWKYLQDKAQGDNRNKFKSNSSYVIYNGFDKVKKAVLVMKY